MILNESKLRIEETRYIENFNFLVFSTQNVYLYDLRYPHFPVSEFPLNINFKGMEVKDIEVFGDQAFLNTRNYYCGIDTTYRDNAHLLFDVQINNEIVLKNEKNEHEKENFDAYQEDDFNNNKAEDYKNLRNESFNNENGNENDSSSNNYEKHFSFSKNKIKNVDRIQNRKRTGSAIEIDDESSSYATYNYNDKNNQFSSDQESNLQTVKKENKFNQKKRSQKLNQINEYNEESSFKEDESGRAKNYKALNNKDQIEDENEESDIEDNNSYKDLKPDKNVLNENVDNLNSAFRKSLNLNFNENYYESFIDKAKEETLNSEFYMEFVDANLINTFRDIHDVAGFLFIKDDSSINDYLNILEFDYTDKVKSNELYEKFFLNKKLKMKNKSKYYLNFTIDQFAGINCNVNKIVNTNNFSVLDKHSENFKKIKKVFADYNEMKRMNENENNRSDKSNQSDKDPLIDLYHLYKKSYISNFFEKKTPKLVYEQNESIVRTNLNENFSKDVIKYETTNLNKIKTKDLNNPSTIKSNEINKNVHNHKNHDNNHDIVMKSDDESLSDISDTSFNDLVNLKEKANNSAEDSDELDAENKDDNDLVDFGKARVNGKLLKMFDLQNKRYLLENILLNKKVNNKNEKDDAYNNSSKNKNKNITKETDLISEISSEMFSKENIKNELKHSYSSDNFLNFHNKFNLNTINNNNHSSINTPKSTVSGFFGFDKKNSENSTVKQINSKAPTNKNCSFNLNLNLNYTEKKMNKKKTESALNVNNSNHHHYDMSERNIYDNINEDDEYEMDDIYNGDLDRHNSENALGNNNGLSNDNLNTNNYNLGGSQSDILNMLFDKLKNEK